MKRRLTISILVAVATALLLVGLGTLVLARFGARRAAEDELRSQVESTANLVTLSQQRPGQLTSNDTKAVRAYLCRNTGPATGASGRTTTTTTPTTPELERLKDVICNTAGTDPANAEQRICTDLPARIEQSLAEDVRTWRDAYCRAPTQTNIDALNNAQCATADNQALSGSGTERRTEQARRYLCGIVRQRSQSRENLQVALSKESIALVVIDHDDQIVEGQFPDGVAPDSIDPARLRAGETVSGPAGTGRFANGSFAATATDPTADDLEVIVIARAADPVQGVVPWFLLASGVTLLIGVVVANSLSKKLTQPLRDATAVTSRIADGDLSVRIPEHRGASAGSADELEALAHSINTMAEALERSRGVERQFLLSVSHDLRTPLTSIRGYAEAIADGAAPDAPAAASVILAESRRLERLVQDLLDLAKLDARRFTFHIIEVDLCEIASDSVDGFRREVEAAGLHLVLDASDNAVVGYADPDRLQQVIANLVENALKFARTTITVRVSGDVDGPCIQVVDDGAGIPVDDLAHVFERLYVTGARPVRKEVGSGLGLAIVRELVEAMGGSVAAQAAAGGGASLAINLATLRPADPPPPPAERV